MALRRWYLVVLVMPALVACGGERVRGGLDAALEPSDALDVRDATVDARSPEPEVVRDAGIEVRDGADDAGVLPWQIRARVDTPVLRPRDDGCLAPTDEIFPGGELLEPLASDGRRFLIDEQGGAIGAMDVEVVSRRPETATVTRAAVVQLASNRYEYDELGCPVPVAELAELTEVDALARSHDANYRGYVVIDRALGLAPVRVIDADGWAYPWHASMQIVKEVPEGFVIGAGVLVGPNAIATVKHLAVDATYCYSREPNSAVAWSNGLFECGNIAGPAEAHPGGVDLAIVHLIAPEPPPYADVRIASLEAGETFYTANLSTGHTHAFTDSTVVEVSNRNASCERWPAGSSFIAADLLVGAGDSGGPAFAGDQVVGLVHGGMCKWPWEPDRHVFVHLPGVRSFLEPFLP